MTPISARHVTPVRSRDLDRACDTYIEWRDACAAVQDAYRAWKGCVPSDGPLAFVLYERALDLEEHAADAYAGAIRRVRCLFPNRDTRPRIRCASTPGGRP